MNVLSSSVWQFYTKTLQFYVAGHWELEGTVHNGHYSDPKTWSFYKQLPKEHWNRHHRTWKYCSGLALSSLAWPTRWISIITFVHLWGIPKTFLGTGSTKSNPSKANLRLEMRLYCSADFCATQCLTWELHIDVCKLVLIFPTNVMTFQLL